MCGGQVLRSPCSRVGRVSREKYPYSFPKEWVRKMAVNELRAIEVWTDAHKIFFYRMNQGKSL